MWDIILLTDIVHFMQILQINVRSSISKQVFGIFLVAEQLNNHCCVFICYFVCPKFFQVILDIGNYVVIVYSNKAIKQFSNIILEDSRIF